MDLLQMYMKKSNSKKAHSDCSQTLLHSVMSDLGKQHDDHQRRKESKGFAISNEHIGTHCIAFLSRKHNGAHGIFSKPLQPGLNARLMVQGECQRPKVKGAKKGGEGISTIRFYISQLQSNNDHIDELTLAVC